MIHHRDEYNAECEKGTAPFMVRLFILVRLFSLSQLSKEFKYASGGCCALLKSCIPLVYMTGGGMQDVRTTGIFINFRMSLAY